MALARLGLKVARLIGSKSTKRGSSLQEIANSMSSFVSLVDSPQLALGFQLGVGLSFITNLVHAVGLVDGPRSSVRFELGVGFGLVASVDSSS